MLELNEMIYKLPKQMLNDMERVMLVELTYKVLTSKNKYYQDDYDIANLVGLEKDVPLSITIFHNLIDKGFIKMQLDNNVNKRYIVIHNANSIMVEPKLWVYKIKNEYLNPTQKLIIQGLIDIKNNGGGEVYTIKGEEYSVAITQGELFDYVGLPDTDKNRNEIHKLVDMEIKGQWVLKMCLGYKPQGKQNRHKKIMSSFFNINIDILKTLN